jgi:hydrogenase expression/formation protein HypE
MNRFSDDLALQQLEKIEVVRAYPARLKDTQITLSHGGGGKATHNLIEALFSATFDNPMLREMNDCAVFAVGEGRMAFTTDSYVVSPIFFPGGDIGELAVNGTVNDLAMSGAQPLYLSCGFILEEGFPVDDLKRIVESMARAAKRVGVLIVTGDTKVVNKGKADKIFINTAGVGVLRREVNISSSNAQPGDKVILSGSIGDHGVTILAARGELELEADFQSDTAPLHELVAAILDVTTEVRCLKDPTRGGVATSLNEIASASSVTIAIKENSIPVRDETRGACEILGIDPLYIANEGKLLAVVPPQFADEVVAAMQQNPLGKEARVIGEVWAEPKGLVFLQTEIGGNRVVDMLVGDPLPRIC